MKPTFSDSIPIDVIESSHDPGTQRYIRGLRYLQRERIATAMFAKCVGFETEAARKAWSEECFRCADAFIEVMDAVE